jgi:hypothetical protein
MATFVELTEKSAKVLLNLDLVYEIRPNRKGSELIFMDPVNGSFSTNTRQVKEPPAYILAGLDHIYKYGPQEPSPDFGVTGRDLD